MANQNSFTFRFQSYLAHSYFAVLIISLVAWSGYLTAEQVDKTGQKTIDAAGLFAEKCLQCHARPGPWPDIAGMAKLEAEEIYRVLSAGLMRELANGLDDAQRKAIAGYVAGLNPSKPSLASGRLCNDMSNPETQDTASIGWRGWSLDTGNTRHVRDIKLSEAQVSGLRLKWSFVFPDTAPFTSTGNQPTVVGNRLYIGSVNGMVYALDADTGCTHWSFKAKAGIRTAVAVTGDRIVFADYETNVYALDAQTGALYWVSRADNQPSARVNGNVATQAGVVYVPISSNQEFTVSFLADTPCCSFQGSVVAFDVSTGRQIWKTSLIDEPLRELGVNYTGVKRYGPSGVSVWSVPTIDVKRQLLYVTTGNQFTEPAVPEADAIVALDLKSGDRRWVKSFAPADFGGIDIWNGGCEAKVLFNTENTCPPMNDKHEGDREIGSPAVIKPLANGKDVLLVGTKEGVLYAIDPDQKGAVQWQVLLSKIPPGRGPIFGGIQYGFAVDNKHVYVPISDVSLIDQISLGNMVSVALETGKLVWEMPGATNTCQDKPFGCNNSYMAAPTIADSFVFTGASDGVLRAFDASNGRIIWSYDTFREFTGVNGLKGKGGSIIRGGPAIVNSMLYQTSGYGHLAMGMPGNVLLAFEFPEN